MGKDGFAVTHAGKIQDMRDGDDRNSGRYFSVMAVIRTHDWIIYLDFATIAHRLNILGEPIMSNNFSASIGATPSATPARATKTGETSFWRRLFAAWVQSYSNRLDPEGNVMCEL
jgi:hypothetical protein